MKGRESKGPPSADLLVCFPSRSRLALMPKPICSPARPNEPNKRHPHHHHRSKSLSRGGVSPLPWARPKPVGPEMSSEPNSPKVTCAGQIKVVRPKTTACKNWQSVMEEIERIHNDKKNKKRNNWVEALGFKKDVVNFLSCLRRVKFDFRCFGSFPNPEIDSDNDEDEEEEEEEEDHSRENSKAVFSKWFMVLQEEQSKNKEKVENFEKIEDVFENSVQVPPPNALLLMRCRSAPAKSWQEEREEEEREKEGKKKRSSLEMVMKCDESFYEANDSLDVVKENWISDDMRDYLTRNRSCKR